MWERIKIAMSETFDFLLPFIKMFFSEGGKLVLSAAVKYVTILASSDMPSGEKRDQAYNLIVADLQSQGIQVVSHIVNAAIEAAVAKIKE